MPNIVRLSTPAQIAASVPALIGFTPDESLIGIAFDGPRLIVTFRIDFVDASRQYVQGIFDSILDRTHIDSAVIVGWSNTRSHDDIAAEMRAAGWDKLTLPLKEQIAVGNGRWTSLQCDDQKCCVPGTPLSTDSLIGDACALIGKQTLRSRDEVVASVRPASQETTAQSVIVMDSLSDADSLRWLIADARTTDAAADVLAMLIDAATRTPLDRVDQVFPFIALIAYIAGDGVLANAALEYIAKLDGLASLVDAAVRAAMPPAALADAALASLAS